MTVRTVITRMLLVASAPLALAACGEPHGKPGDYVQLKGAINPSGRLGARLIGWRESTNPPKASYFVIVTSTAFVRNDTTLAATREGNSVLHARNAQNLQFEWPSDTELVIRCNACGMQLGDVLHTANRAEPVRVTFIGLPGVANK